MNKVQVQNVPIGQIKPYWRNPRRNQKTVAALKASIEKYGFNVPLVLDANYVIITGHARYKALMQMGWEDIPCIISPMNEQQAKEYRIADNKTSEISEWDKQQLESEIREIGNLQFLNEFFAGDDIIGKFSFGGINNFDINTQLSTPQNEQKGTPQEQPYKTPVHSRDIDDIPPREDNRVYTPAAKIEEESSEPRYYKDGYNLPLTKEQIQQNIKPVTESQLIKAQQEQDGVIDRINERKEAAYIQLICPCCQEEFGIDFNTIQKLLKNKNIANS